MWHQWKISTWIAFNFILTKLLTFASQPPPPQSLSAKRRRFALLLSVFGVSVRCHYARCPPRVERQCSIIGAHTMLKCTHTHTYKHTYIDRFISVCLLNWNPFRNQTFEYPATNAECHICNSHTHTHTHARKYTDSSVKHGTRSCLSPFDFG